MSINCKLYKNKRTKPHLSRLLTAIADYNIPDANIETLSLTDPVITVKNSDFINVFQNVNYMYLGAPFNRYYFLKSPIAGEDGVTRIPCHVDVLYTYKNIIANSSCIAKRSSSNYNIAFPDNMVQYEKGYHYTFSRFPFTFTPEAGEYILQIGGR